MVDESFSVTFVHLVKKYPCIYDTSHADYGRRERVDRAWAAIAKEANDSDANCRMRWKNIRTAFGRNMKDPSPSGASSKARKKYYMHEELQFLVPHMKGKKRVGNLHNEASGDVCQVTEEGLPSEEFVAVDTSSEVTPGKEPKERKRRGEVIADKILGYLQRESSEESGDRSFLLGLLPDFKSLDPKRKRKFKVKVTQLLADLHEELEKDL